MAARFRRSLDRYVQACAWLVLKRHQPVIVGITGTAGKSTTKEMLASILQEDFARARYGLALVTSGNLNDDRGLPLTVLGFKDWIFGRLKAPLTYLAMPIRVAALVLKKDYPRLLVLEYGTHEHGHLHDLVRLARPNIGVVINVGAAHLETLGSLKGVADEKAALVISPPSDGAVILGAGHSFVDYLAGRAKAPVTIVDGVGFDLNCNIARAVGQKLGLPSQAIEAGLPKFTNPPRRLVRHEVPGLTVIDDSHNANPISMRFALETLRSAPRTQGRKIALLGAMAELATDSEQEHAAIGQEARSAADLVLGVGEAAKAYRPHHWFEDAEACRKQLGEHLRDGDLVLVKGSASSGMQTVADSLLSSSDAA